MRICVYCGKELGQGELCDCKMAIQRRNEKKAGEPPKTGAFGSNFYRTGYTKKQSAFKRRWERFKNKRSAVKSGRVQPTGSAKGFFYDAWQFIKAPVESVENPKAYSIWEMLLIAAIQGAIIGLSIFFVTTGTSRSIFRNLANIMGLGGVGGYKVIISMLYWAVSGAICYAVFFLLYSCVFWLIDRFVFRRHLSFTEMSQRLVMTTVPMSALAAVGVCISFLSLTTLMILMLCGVLITLILTYIALSGEWSAYPPSKVMYSVILGYFVLFTVICTVLSAAVI